MAVDCLLWLIQQPSVLICAREGAPRWQFKCYRCREALLPGQIIQFDHIHADIHGGPHEYQNLRPVHYDPCHKKKTKADVQANAKIKRLRGENKPRVRKRIPSRPMKSCAKALAKRQFQKKK